MSGFMLRNETVLEFSDISSELRREYHFHTGKILTIKSPMRLNVSASGGHRVVDETNECYYIKPTWDYITWIPREGEPHFVK